MKILAVSENEYAGDVLIPGKYYNAEEADEGTLAQNRAWHGLLQEYWKSGAHSYPARNYLHFRELIKLHLGAGLEQFISLANEDGSPCPEGRISYRVKRWRDYSKKQRANAIDNLIADIIQAEAMTPKIQEIILGMEQNSLERSA